MFDHKSPGMTLRRDATALVFTDLHNDFLHPWWQGVRADRGEPRAQ